MEYNKKIEKGDDVVLLYAFPGDHQPRSALKWLLSLVKDVEESGGCVLANNEEEKSIFISLKKSQKSILEEISKKEIDFLLINLKLCDCMIVIAVNLKYYIISIGIEKKNEKKIGKIEDIIFH